MSTAKDLPQARASAAADQARRGLVSSAGGSLAGRTKALLASHGLRPRKSLGQNFLINEPRVRQIAAAAAALAPDGLVLEVGPGLGALTVALAELGCGVLAYEVDQRLEGPLRELLAPFDRVTVQFGDFLEVDLDAVTAGRPFVLAGNLPYQITTPLLEKLFAASLCRALVITVQREVAQRLQAGPGSKDYGPLTLFCQYHVARMDTVCQLAPGDFLPPPEVASTALRLLKRETPPFAEPGAAVFSQVVRSAFNQRRKAVRAALAGAPFLTLTREQVNVALAAAGLDGQRRAETLSLDELAVLARELDRVGGLSQ